MGTTKRSSGSLYEFLQLILILLFKDSLKASNPTLEVLMEGTSLTEQTKEESYPLLGCLWKS